MSTVTIPPFLSSLSQLLRDAQSMQMSGYNEKQRKIVLETAVMRYNKELEMHDKGEKDIYRSRDMREAQMKSKGGKADKGNWFRKKGKKDTTSVLIVPYTCGVLANEVRERIRKCREPVGVKTKVIEGGGDKLSNSLIKQDPFPRPRCYREDCPAQINSMEGCGETCFQQHVTYEARCNVCVERKNEMIERGVPRKELPPDYVYIGETSRGVYIRQKGHKAQYAGRKINVEDEGEGFMHRHAQDQHGGDKNLKFTFKRTSSDKEPMRRVIRESIQIINARKNRSVKLLNGKDEYFGVRVVTPRFIQE